jgi:DNA mismatch endonuclease (patch repair protein)
MASIHSKWSRIDRKAHGMLKSAKVKHRMYPDLPGSPDVLVYPNVLVFMDGCFWHSCPRCGRPAKSRLRYWMPKMERNRDRDKRVSKSLRKQGWVVLRVWEHEVTSNPRKLVERVMKLIA